MADTDRYLKIKNIFLNALELDDEQRAEYIKKECGDDNALYTEVLDKLKQANSDLFEKPVLGNIGDQFWDAAQHSADQIDLNDNINIIHSKNKPGQSDSFASSENSDQNNDDLTAKQNTNSRNIGDYKILHMLATGGMGTVYLAIQNEPKRKVALKVMRRGISSRSSFRRFQFEAQILARLRHPNIAQIYEAGRHYEETAFGRGEGLPFFAMEYIPSAKTIIEYAETNNLDIPGRLKLMLKVCDAVHHGHQKGIIHRDLKPGNILVNASGEPKIIDFGVARVTDSDMAVTTQQTNVGQLVGTLQYMSPEQCEADPDGLDIRSDVYALGVLLFELICGRTPYDLSNAPVYEAARIIREQKPHKPSTISKLIRGDLETIVLKALEKEREQRYQSAASLMRDIQRFLNSEPIEARPPSIAYQFKMFAQRNRTVFSAIMATVLVLVIATIISLVFGIRSVKAEREATRQAKRSEDVLKFITEELLSAANPNNSLGDKITVRELLDQVDNKISRFEDDKETQITIRETIGVIYRTLGQFQKAELQLSQALNIQKASYPEAKKATLRMTLELASVYRDEGQFNEAAKLMYDIVSIYKNEKPVSVELPDAMSKLALILRLGGEMTEAKSIINEAYAIAIKLKHMAPAEVLKIRENLALILNDNQQCEEAEIILREVLRQQQNISTKITPSLLLTMHRLSIVLADSGKLDEADEIMTEVLAGRRMVFAKDKYHPRILSSMTYLGMIKCKEGDLEEAESLLSEALKLRKENVNLGESHIETLQNMWLLAEVYQAQQRTSDGELLLKDAITQAEAYPYSVNAKIFGLALCEYQYAIFLANNNRYPEAESLLLNSYNQLVNSYSIHNSYAQRSLTQLIGLYELQGKTVLAESYRDKIVTPNQDN